MEEKEIDAVLADALVPGDLIKTANGYETVKETEPNEVDASLLNVYTQEQWDEPHLYEWDAVVPLYGY